MKDDTARRRRLASLPAVHVLLGHPSLKALADETGHAGVTEAVRKTLADARAGLLRHPDAPSVDTETLVARVVGSLADGVTSLRPVVNASGILLHPAAPPPLAAEAVEAMRIAQTSAVYNVEPHIREHLRVLTDAEDTLIVHTPQAGLYLIADALGRGKEWVVSRAHLGAGPGAWSLPDVLGRCVGGLVEVGATNKTHLTDYRRAVGPATGAILVARPGVYALRGFVEEPALSDIACLGKETGVPVVFDAGHAPLTPDGPERRFASLAEAVRDGAALTVVRGDGLAGGPASGLIAGQRAWIETLRNHPIYPMIKPSWPVLAGWEATLRVLRARGPAGHPAGFWFGGLRRYPARPCRAVCGSAVRLAGGVRDF